MMNYSLSQSISNENIESTDHSRMAVSSDSNCSNKSTVGFPDSNGLSQENFRLKKNNDVNQLIDDVSVNESQQNVNNEKQIVSNNNHDPLSIDDSDNEEMIMSVFWRSGKFGAAYYNTSTSELHILNEIIDRKPEHSMLRNLYRQVQPVIVITDARAQDTFQCCLKDLAFDNNPNSDSETNESSNTTAKIYYLPTKEYSFNSCKQRIYLLRLPNEPAESSDDDHNNFLHSIINFHYLQTIQALGALLKYLDKNWCTLSIDKNASPSFLSISTISLKSIVTIDNESYKALQIFNRLSHPSNFKKGTVNSAKEGLSLFGIFNKCHSKLGMQYLRLLLQHPTNNTKVLEMRYNTIAFCNKTGHEEVVKSICTSLRHIKNVNGIVTRIKNMRASTYEWKSLFDTLYNGVLICEFCEKYQGYSALIDSLGSRNNYDLFQVAHHMNCVIDFDLSKIQGKFTVRLGVDPELDRKKQAIMSLHTLMSPAAKTELEKLPPFIEECTMVYLPNLGYLLGVKAWGPNLTREEKELPNLKFMFQNHDYIHYKSEGCEEMDSLIGDTHPEIWAHEMRIMMRLTKFILQHLHTLSTVIKLCAKLDCLIAIAKVCRDNNYQRPTITAAKVIDIKEGRHPLQELSNNNFIPNSTKSSVEGNLVTILTGPNACGKSVYLKQIALIAYMAHIGSFVPAKSATIGLLDHIYTRVQTVEDICTRMSAFLIDLRQMSLTLQESTSSSLIIIDEFGKGTSEVDGLSLLAASINNFLYRGTETPHVFVSTHFHCINQYLESSPHLKLQTLEHIIQDKELVFLYKLKDEVAESSLALQVAESVGIDSSIIKRAKHVFDCLGTNTPSPNQVANKYTAYKNTLNKMEAILSGKNFSKALFNNMNRN